MIDRDYIYGLKPKEKGGREDNPFAPVTKATSRTNTKVNADGTVETTEEKVDENPWEDDSTLLTNQDSPYYFSGMQNLPPEWAWASNFLGGLAESGGAPVDTAGIFEKWIPKMSLHMEERGAELAEQYGYGGLRWSEPLLDALMK